MPESVTDRPTKAHEYIFLMSKSAKYYYDADAIKDPAVTQEKRPDGVVRSREWGYDTKQDRLEGRSAARYKGFNKRYFSENKKRGAFNGKYGDAAFRAVRESRNKRSVWTVATQPFKDAHFAVFPEKLIEPCILAGCPENGIVLDPFIGSGTVAAVSKKHGRKFVGIDLKGEYIDMAKPRLAQEVLL
jgi:hypothetical protein